jgi:hypothetical protein
VNSQKSGEKTMSLSLLGAFWNAINQVQDPVTVRLIHSDPLVVNGVQVSPLVRKLSLERPLTWGTIESERSILIRHCYDDAIRELAL